MHDPYMLCPTFCMTSVCLISDENEHEMIWKVRRGDHGKWDARQSGQPDWPLKKGKGFRLQLCKQV